MFSSQYNYLNLIRELSRKAGLDYEGCCNLYFLTRNIDEKVFLRLHVRGDAEEESECSQNRHYSDV